nr:hypothetical protein [Tanacetum cinerariifolium]
MRINPTKTQKEPTYQVVLDALALTTCYPAFFITIDGPEIYMHQFWFTINKHDSSYRFKIDKKRDTKKQEKMYYPRFTKAIIHHFITKDKSISMRNIMFMHTAYDDNILGPMRFVSKADEFQVYEALFPEVMTNQKMQKSPTYKTYLAFATGATSPKKAKKFKKPASSSRKKTLVTIEEEDPEPAKKDVPFKNTSRKQSTDVQIRDTPGVSVSNKKPPATTDTSNGIDLLSKAALLKEAKVKKFLKRSRQEITIHQIGGLGDRTSSKPGVPDEPKGKFVDINEAISLKPGVPNVSKAESSKSKYESWGNSGDEASVQGDDEDVQDSDDNP